LGGNNPNVDGTINGGRTEHYYSEINEYESVSSVMVSFLNFGIYTFYVCGLNLLSNYYGF
jgi:hypothetical protein